MRRMLLILLVVVCCFLAPAACSAGWFEENFGVNPLYFDSGPISVKTGPFSYIRPFQDSITARALEMFVMHDGVPGPVASITVSKITGWWGANNSGYSMSGCLGADGRVYWAPCHASAWAIYNPVTNTLVQETFGLSWSGTYQYVGMVAAPNGKLYAIPANATEIAVVDTSASPVTAVKTTMGALLSGTYKWYGGALAPNGKIYCAPYAAASVLVIDTKTDTATTTTLGASWSGYYKYFGAALGGGGIVAFAPYSSTLFAFVNTDSDIATRTAVSGVPLSGGAIFSGCCALPNGNIYYAAGFETNVYGAFVSPAKLTGFYAQFETGGTNGVNANAILAGDGMIYGSGRFGAPRRYKADGSTVAPDILPLPAGVSQMYSQSIVLANSSGTIIVMMPNSGSGGADGLIRYDIGGDPGARGSSAVAPWFNKGF